MSIVSVKAKDGHRQKNKRHHYMTEGWQRMEGGGCT